MTAYTYERDLDHPVSAEVEQTIRSVLEEHLSSQGLEDVKVNPGLDTTATRCCSCTSSFAWWNPASTHAGSAIAPSQCAELWNMGERRFPHLRYDFHDDQRILGTENW